MAWTINGDTFEELGLGAPTLALQSLGVDVLTLPAPARNVDAALLFDYLDPIVLANGGTVWFRGHRMLAPVSGGGFAESHSYTAVGPWWYLENLPYLQPWKIRGGTESEATVYTSRSILGISFEPEHVGERLTMGEMIVQILTYAADDCSAPLAVGTIDLPMPCDTDEVCGLTCAEAILKILRLAPDAVGWWDYTANPPELNIVQAAGRSAVSVALAGADRVSLTRRDDLPPPSVVVVFERDNTVDGIPVRDVTVDADPEGATGREVGAVVHTVGLHGSDTTYLKQQVLTEDIELDVTPGAALRRARIYWGARFAELKDAVKREDDPAVPDIVFWPLIEDGPYFGRELAQVTDEDEDGPFLDRLANASEAVKKAYWADGHPNTAYDETTAREDRMIRLADALPRELIQGVVAKWMVGVEAQAQVFVAKISYNTGSSMTVPRRMRYQMVATDAVTRIYTMIENVIAGEPVPVGLAAAIRAALAPAPYTGRVDLVRDECLAVSPGASLSLTGGQDGWTTMAAPVQQVTYDFGEGSTQIAVGPPRHLGVEEMRDAQRAMRRREGSTGARFANVRCKQFGQP